MRYSTIIQNVTVPIYDLLRGTSRYKCGKVLEKTQYLSRKEIVGIQEKNLQFLVKHVYENVPYYRRIFRKKRLAPSDIKTIRDLTRLPILTKEDVRKNFQDLVSRAFSSNQLIPYETGGTGSPLRFYITKEKNSWEVAAEFRFYGWAGYRLGDRCFMLWGSHKDLQTNLLKWIAGRLERRMSVDPFLLSDEVLSRYSVLLQRFKPSVIRGYATPVYMLARYLLENHVQNIRPRVVITGAETLLDPMRKTISEGFGCPVYDYYGSREIGAIASECEKHRGHHIAAENVVTEFVRDGESVGEGEHGLLLLTGLRNYGMPLIRYQNGDVGEPSDADCSCGRGLPMIKSIKGRASQFLAVRDRKSGKIVPLDASLMMECFMIWTDFPPAHYRVIQDRIDHITIKIVRGMRYSDEGTELLVREMKKAVGEDVEIEVDFVDDLPPLPSGKRSPVISKVNAF